MWDVAESPVSIALLESFVDGRLLTGQNPASSTSAAQGLLNLVGSQMVPA